MSKRSSFKSNYFLLGDKSRQENKKAPLNKEALPGKVICYW